MLVCCCLKDIKKQYVAHIAVLFVTLLAVFGALFAMKQVRFAGRWHELISLQGLHYENYRSTQKAGTV